MRRRLFIGTLAALSASSTAGVARADSPAQATDRGDAPDPADVPDWEGTPDRVEAPDPPPPPPEPKVAHDGFMLGVSVSELAPVFPHVGSGDHFFQLPNYSPGPGVGVTAGRRWGAIVLGASYEHGFIGGGVTDDKSSVFHTAWVHFDSILLDLIAVPLPGAVVSPYARVAVGAGFVRYASDQSFPGVGGYGNVDVSFGFGAEVHLSYLRVVPELGAGIGPLGLYGEARLTTYFDSGGRP
jgi:hypothetical protein